MIGESQVKKQIGGRGYFARVHVACLIGGEQFRSVSLDPSADEPWYRSEGWTHAAMAGAALGLKLADAKAACTITQITGMHVDSNPTLMAIAAIRAVWEALGFEPAEELAAFLEAAIFRKTEWSVSDLERELSQIVRCT
ncbi:MAG: hypothetical protein QM775_14235 [Pirellulales bacterium]